MARQAVFRNHLLPIAIALAVIGLIPTVIAFFVADYGANPGPSWYTGVVPTSGWNTWVQLIAPIVLITGLWYAGEQILLRRRFHELLDAPKRSDLQKNLPELESISGRLPKGFEDLVEAKEASYASKR